MLKNDEVKFQNGGGRRHGEQVATLFLWFCYRFCYECLAHVAEASELSLGEHVNCAGARSLHRLDDLKVDVALRVWTRQLQDPQLVQHGLQALQPAKALLLQPASQAHRPLGRGILDLHLDRRSTHLDVDVTLLLEAASSLMGEGKTEFGTGGNPMHISKWILNHRDFDQQGNYKTMTFKTSKHHC